MPPLLSSAGLAACAALTLSACAGAVEQSPLPGGSATQGVIASVSLSGAADLTGSGSLSGGGGSVCDAPNAGGTIAGHTVHITLITEAAPFGTPLPLSGYAITVKVDSGSWSVASSNGRARGSLLLGASGGTLTFQNLGSDTGTHSTLSGSVRWTCD